MNCSKECRKKYTSFSIPVELDFSGYTDYIYRAFIALYEGIELELEPPNTITLSYTEDQDIQTVSKVLFDIITGMAIIYENTILLDKYGHRRSSEFTRSVKERYRRTGVQKMKR